MLSSGVFGRLEVVSCEEVLSELIDFFPRVFEFHAKKLFSGSFKLPGVILIIKIVLCPGPLRFDL